MAKGKELLDHILQRLRVIKPKHILWLLIIAYFVFFSWYSLLRHYTFQTGAGDLGFFAQAFWTTSNGRPLFLSLWDDLGATTLAHHVQPILFVLLPVYLINQSPETLLVLQSFFLALGALPIYWISTKRFKPYVGLVFASLYLMYPALHGINTFDFHFASLAIPFFLFSFHYLEEKNYYLSALFSILAIMCREDAALTVGMIVLYALWKDRAEIKALKQKSRTLVFSLLLLVFSAVWFLLSVQIIVPHFNASGVYVHTGKFFPSLMRLELPFEQLFFAIEDKYMYAVLLFIPLQFLPFLSPLTLAITLPAWAISLLSKHYPAFQIGYQYPYTIIPFLFVSAVYGLKQLALSEQNMKKVLALFMIFGTVFMLFMSPTPLGVYGEYDEVPEVTFHHKALNEIIDMIPPDASLSSQNDIFPHVCNRFVVHCGYRNTDEYVIVDFSSDWFVLRPDEVEEILNEYGLVTSIDNIYLFKRGYDEELVELPIDYGISAEVYDNKDLVGSPIFETKVFTIDYVWGSEPPFLMLGSDSFSIRFESNIKISQDGNYIFEIHSDDGFRLNIDNETVTEFWGPGVFEENATLSLEEGMHTIEIEYVEYSANAFLNLYWITPNSNEFELVPENVFFID